MPPDLVILRGSERLRWGGDLRRRYLFEALEERLRTTVVAGFGRPEVRAALAPYRRRRWEVWRRGPVVVSTELLDTGMLDLVRRVGTPLAVDIHDEPVLQAEALGVGMPPQRVAELRERMAANSATFRRTIVPSESFRRLAGIDAGRAIIAPNGTDTEVVRPVAPPSEPAVAFISGAAPARGIESLIEAVRLARDDVRGTRLLLFLTATGDESARYLEALIAAHQGDPWLEIGALAYPEVGAGLGRATVLCIPTPSHPYWDSVPPLKLLDGMAAGRPTVVTPRTEMRAVVERADAGLVAAGDAPADIAASLVELLRDPDRARRMGENARRAAETTYDWRVISRQLARDLLATG